MNDSFSIMKMKQLVSERWELGINGHQTLVRQRRKKLTSQKVSGDSWWYLGRIGQIGFDIAIPIVGGALLGKYIDSLVGSYPKATLTLLLLGVVLSLVTFIRTIQEIINKKI